MHAFLRVHSHYSLLQATSSIKQIVTRAQEDGLHAVALTDFGVLYGAVDWVKTCQQGGIKPIVGMVFSIMAPELATDPQSIAHGELVALAKNRRGFRSLCELSTTLQKAVTKSKQDGSLSWKEFIQHSEGLICLTGGENCVSTKYVRSGNPENAVRYLSHLSSIFGNDCYLSLETHQDSDEELIRSMVEIADRFGIAPVAVQPVFCMTPEDRVQLTLLAAIRENIKLESVIPEMLPKQGNAERDIHWLDAGEFKSRFSGIPQSLSNLEQVVAKCKDPLPKDKAIWPKIDLPQGTSSDKRLSKLARQGLHAKYGHQLDADIESRFERELDQISDEGYAPLFLLVAEIVHFAEKSGIPYGSRGSVANSLIAYCLGISRVDPIQHELLFERFLNPERPDLPDIDLDFCSQRRDEVINHVFELHGKDHVAQVGTINTLRLRSAVREVAKSYGCKEDQIKRLASMAPRRWHPDPRRRSGTSLKTILQQLEDPTEREIFERATKIVGMPDHLSIHPGGMIITPSPLTDYLPVQFGTSGHAVTQFDHTGVEAIGIPKIDLLGNRALSVIAEIERLVEENQISQPAEVIGQHDQLTSDLLTRADTIGVFQCESEGARRTLKKLQVKTVEDLAIANAFFKPGPATGGMADRFIMRYRGEEPVHFLHPSLKPILKNTKGVLLFQEQVLRVAVEIAGLSWGDADILRRGMTKFRPDYMDQLKSKFLEGCRRTPPHGVGMDQQQALTLWEQVRAFSGYGFNQGHATSYAQISYQMASLKAHYPATFLCARLNVGGGYHHPAVYMEEARAHGYEICPPHVNVSARRFTLSSDERPFGDGPQLSLWIGLDQIRDLRQAAIDKILVERGEIPFRDLGDLINRVPLQNREIRNLVRCGALDGLGTNRQQMLEQAGKASSKTGSSQLNLWSEPEPVKDVEPESVGLRFRWEMEILGMPVSVAPLDLVDVDDMDSRKVSRIERRLNAKISVVGYRIPGWSGSGGFFLADWSDYIQVKFDHQRDHKLTMPPAWRPLELSGRWQEDEWGMGWFEALAWREFTTQFE